MKKKVLKIVLIAVAVLLAAALAGLVVFGWYAPRYLADKTTYDVHTKEPTDDITIMSFNIRCIAVDDLFRKSWFYRAPLVVRTIAEEEPDIIGMQEVTPTHEKYLRKHLQGYSFVVAYRTAKGIKEGMMLAYRNDRFQLVEEGRFWVSETPEVESKDWGSAFPRVATYATLKDTRTGKTFTALDTHLDHVSEEARGEGMRVLVEQREARGWDTLVMMGDMNDVEGSLQYTCAMNNGFTDAQKAAETCYTGAGATYQGFGKKLNSPRIDYFYLTAQFTVLDYHVVDKTFDGVYASDHFAIAAKVRL